MNKTFTDFAVSDQTAKVASQKCISACRMLIGSKLLTVICLYLKSFAQLKLLLYSSFYCLFNITKQKCLCRDEGC